MTLCQDTLYHYTSSAAMRSIWETRSIWATHSFYLNDSTEYLYGYQRVTHEFQWEPNLKDFRARYTEVYEHIAAAIQPHENGRRRAVFVASLSEEGDDLNQWRSYTSPGDGYAIAVNLTLIANIAAARGWRLAKCLYGREANVAVQALLVRGVQNLVTSIEARDEAGVEAGVDDLARRMAILAPTLKDGAFAAESEWRLISPTTVHTDAPVKYRSCSSFMAPYLEFPLGDQFDDVIRSAVVGPGPNQDLASEAFGMWLSQDGSSRSWSASEVPYRPW